METQQEQAAKKDKTLLNLLMAGCGCLLLIGVLFGVFFEKIVHYMRAPGKTVNAQLDAINDGNYPLAYKYFSARYKEKNSLEDFRKEMSAFASLLPSQEFNTKNIQINNNRATIDGTIKGTDGAIFPVHYELIKENGEWKISGLKWTFPGDRQAI